MINENDEPEKCVWFNNKIAKLAKKIYMPNNISRNIIKNNINGIKYETIKHNNDNIDFNYKDLPDIFFSHFDKTKKKYNKIFEKSKIKNIDLPMDEFVKKIEYISEKYEKDLLKYDKIIRSFKYLLDFNDEQKNIIHKWFDECDKVYNKCVDIYNNTNNFDLNYKKSKVNIFKMLYKNEDKGAPYDMLTDEVRIFCSNVLSCLTNLANKNIKHYTINERKIRNQHSILIPKKSFSKNGFFKTFLGDIKDFANHIDYKKIDCDCRLIYDKKTNSYYLSIPEYIKINEPNLNKKPFVALDPGEKNFMTYYTLNEYGKIGINMRKRILNIRGRISIYQKKLAKNINKNNKKIKNKMKLKKKINKQYRKIRNIVKELHNQTALKLCKEYERIILPEFKTQKMVSNKEERISKIKENILKIRNEDITENEKIEKINSYRKRRKLNRKVKFVLNNLSHYRFKQHILNKAQEYGCKIIIVTEEYTSMTCGNCGMMSKKYTNRIKECESCKHKIDRDINGARNIFLKNHKEVIEK